MNFAAPPCALCRTSWKGTALCRAAWKPAAKTRRLFRKSGEVRRKTRELFRLRCALFNRPHRVRPPSRQSTRIVPHFSTFRLALPIFTFTLRRFSSRGHAPAHTSRSRTRTSPSFDFLCSPFTSLLTNSYREGCGEGNGELCVKALQVKPSHAIRWSWVVCDEMVKRWTQKSKNAGRARNAREGFSEGGREGWGYRTVKKNIPVGVLCHCLENLPMKHLLHKASRFQYTCL